MNWIKRNIPNLFTLSNLTLGVLAIQQVILSNGGDEPKVHYYVFLAAFFDLLDGAVARALKVSSRLGVQLDSLADLITFGVLPTFIYASIFEMEGWGLLILLVPVCSAIRLAVFNISEDQKTSFKGISTTAHGLFASTLPIIIWTGDSYFGQSLAQMPYIAIIIAVFFSYLMVSPLRMISLKFEGLSLAKNWEKYALLIVSLLLVVFMGYDSAPWIMMLYLLLSIIINFRQPQNTME
ncbi:CDP-alcohol phosphatidyltransferase family protein [Roseivirga sp.]|uniref:CDP-alcohol phosphatidyltransferase family protein n=1 Tax=Roseivirga sp. TaxID=1964215 RepID=UPI003B515E92